MFQFLKKAKNLWRRLATLKSRLREAKRAYVETQALLRARLARPYYPLNDGWALTYLDTGQPFYVNTEDRTVTPWIVMGGHWETNVDDVLTAYAAPGMAFADIGAHMGYYSVKIGARLGSTGRVIAFEPNPAMEPFARRNVGINGLANAVVHPFGLGDVATRFMLTFSEGDMAQANLVAHGKADHAFEVIVHRLDDIFDGTLDLIKLDAEGFEPRVLSGAQATLARSPNCALMIEVNLSRWESEQPLARLFDLVGRDKAVLAVKATGGLIRMSEEEVRDHLAVQMFTEGYLFFCPQNAVHRVAHLIH